MYTTTGSPMVPHKKDSNEFGSCKFSMALCRDASASAKVSYSCNFRVLQRKRPVSYYFSNVSWNSLVEFRLPQKPYRFTV